MRLACKLRPTSDVSVFPLMPANLMASRSLTQQGAMTGEERGQNTTHTILYALDAETGQELYSSKDLIDDWTHLSSVTVADGSVYVTTRKTIVYAFGLTK